MVVICQIKYQAKTARDEEKTVTDEEFYKKFFEAVETEIKALSP